MVLEKLKTELKIRGFSSKTITAYVKKNEDFLEFIEKTPESIEEDDIKAYMVHLMDKGHKPASVSRAMASLRFLYDEMLAKYSFFDSGFFSGS